METHTEKVCASTHKRIVIVVFVKDFFKDHATCPCCPCLICL